MAKKKPVSKIVGAERRPVSGEASRSSHSVTAPGPLSADARDAVCLDCGEPTTRDETRPAPFDVVCERCVAIRGEVQRRIQQSLESLDDAPSTGHYFKPVRPSWAKWRRKTSAT